jgi:transposase-like protein
VRVCGMPHARARGGANPLERVNREVGRRTDVVGIFPDDRAAIRLAGRLLIEQNDEWLVGRGYLSTEPQREEVRELQPA